MIIKPKPYYSSLSDMRISNCKNYNDSKLNDLTWWPCLECGGTKWIYDPKEEPDMIEGYKLVNKIKCTKCNGTGDNNKKEYILQYKEIRKKYLDKLALYKKSIKRIKEIKKILSNNDMSLVYRFVDRYHFEN